MVDMNASAAATRPKFMNAAWAGAILALGLCLRFVSAFAHELSAISVLKLASAPVLLLTLLSWRQRPFVERSLCFVLGASFTVVTMAAVLVWFA